MKRLAVVACFVPCALFVLLSALIAVISEPLTIASMVVIDKMEDWWRK